MQVHISKDEMVIQLLIFAFSFKEGILAQSASKSNTQVPGFLMLSTSKCTEQVCIFWKILLILQQPHLLKDSKSRGAWGLHIHTALMKLFYTESDYQSIKVSTVNSLAVAL